MLMNMNMIIGNLCTNFALIVWQYFTKFSVPYRLREFKTKMD